VEEFLLHYEEESANSAGDGKIYLPKFAPTQVFDGMMMLNLSLLQLYCIRNFQDVRFKKNI
jgi:hypothetical protein